MASLTNMPLDSYLAHIIVAKLKKRVYTDDSSVTCVRIGIVFDHLNPKFSEEVRRVVKRDVDVSKDCIKDSFKKLSIRNKVFSITKKMCVGVVDTEQVERCFDDILKSYTAYINTFRIYSRYFKSILDDAEVSAKTANVDAISNIEIKNYALKTSEHFKSIRNYECDDNIKEYPKSELIKAVNTFWFSHHLWRFASRRKSARLILMLIGEKVTILVPVTAMGRTKYNIHIVRRRLCVRYRILMSCCYMQKNCYVMTRKTPCGSEDRLCVRGIYLRLYLEEREKIYRRTMFRHMSYSEPIHMVQ